MRVATSSSARRAINDQRWCAPGASGGMSASRAGTTVTLTASRPLVADTSHFPDPGNLGFAARDNLDAIMPAGITSAAVSGSTVTLTVAPSVASVEYAQERVAGALASGDATVVWTDGEADTEGSPGRTPGMWGVLRAAGTPVPCAYAPGAVIKDWLEAGRWAV